MAKKPYRPYEFDLGPRTYSSNETEEERDRREYAWELSDRPSSLVQDEVEEFVKTQFNGDYKAARVELEKRSDDIYARAGAQAVMDMQEDKIALDAKYAKDFKKAEPERKAQKEKVPRMNWLERINQPPKNADDAPGERASYQQQPKESGE